MYLCIEMLYILCMHLRCISFKNKTLMSISNVVLSYWNNCVRNWCSLKKWKTTFIVKKCRYYIFLLKKNLTFKKLLDSLTFSNPIYYKFCFSEERKTLYLNQTLTRIRLISVFFLNKPLFQFSIYNSYCVNEKKKHSIVR